LLHVGKAQALVDWVLGLPKGINVIFDPGPLVESPDEPLMNALLPRIDVWTSNSVEALRFTGATDIGEALDRLVEHLPADVLMVVRDGPQGCWIRQRGDCQHVPGFKVDAVDSNGAGDAHAGVFVAGLAQGLSAVEAARRANAAAALAVTRWGPATSPGTAQVDAFIRETFGG
jgi:sugar/nucleoside kinase (ribokinase family)